MANLEHIEILKSGQQAWNSWRKANPNIHPDLSDTDLAGADLEDFLLTSSNLSTANLQKANLQGARLRSANLKGAILHGAFMSDINLMDANLEHQQLRRAKLHGAFLYRTRLEGADLREAFLGGSILVEANLTNANLAEARLNQVNLTGARLTGANLSHVQCDRTVFANTDLSEVTGLETITHNGPSSIGVDTLLRSAGRIPQAFLRGTGVPDDLIAYSDSLNNSHTFHSVFISYSTKDTDFATRLHADLQNNGVRCWYAPEDLGIGSRFPEAIDKSIHQHDKLLLVLSQHSIGSPWVEQEVNTALSVERSTGNTVLFPVRLDDQVMGENYGWPANIRNSRHIGDFREWKTHDKYEAAFSRLLRDLKH